MSLSALAILDLDITFIVNIYDVQLRKAELYHLLAKKKPSFPWEFLFTEEEKLNISPFRWAPASLLDLKPFDIGHLRGDRNNVVAVLTELGLQLHANHPSCLLSFDEGANTKKCMLIRIGALSYVLCLVPKKVQCRSSGRVWEGADKHMHLNADPRHDWTESWRAQYGFRPTGNWGLIYTRGAHYAVIVAINDAKEKVLYTTLVGQVDMYELRTSHALLPAGLNVEHWGQLGVPMLDENKLRQEREEVEREIFDQRYYNYVNCDMRFEEDTLWCIG